jgi:hypothetical protein
VPTKLLLATGKYPGQVYEPRRETYGSPRPASGHLYVGRGLTLSLWWHLTRVVNWTDGLIYCWLEDKATQCTGIQNVNSSRGGITAENLRLRNKKNK